MTSSLGNLDLFSVGLAIAGIGILGFMVLFSNRKSVTNWTFLFLAISVVIYSTANYLSYKFNVSTLSLLFLRLTIFSAVWFAFFIFQLLYVFPREQIIFPRWYKFTILPTTIVVSFLTLTPFVFNSIQNFGGADVVPIVQPNLPGIILFGLVAVGLDVAGIAMLIKKTLAAVIPIEKKQFSTVLIGAAITLTLLIVFNFILPIFFHIQRFIPYAAVCIFPFIVFTAYAIFKHHLLNIKIVATEALAFVLAIVTFSEVVFSQSLIETLFRTGEFMLVLSFGILLIKSVLHEVEQREELERLNKQIEAQNAQLQDLSHFKSELLSLASHQIKSPLAAIKGFASLIADGSYGPVGDPVKETIAKIQRSADELIALINILLDVRKVEEGKMEYKFERVDLADMIAKTTDMIQPLAEAKHLSLAFDFQRKPVWVNADPEKLKQVVQNLIDNAIKYTPSGFVKIHIKEMPAANGVAGIVMISVSDSGLGIPTDLIPHLFEEFVRDDRVKKEIRGTGLGLYIARKIVEAHGGKISAESPGEGKGSTFSVSLPEII